MYRFKCYLKSNKVKARFLKAMFIIIFFLLILIYIYIYNHVYMMWLYIYILIDAYSNYFLIQLETHD